MAGKRNKNGANRKDKRQGNNSGVGKEADQNPTEENDNIEKMKEKPTNNKKPQKNPGIFETGLWPLMFSLWEFVKSAGSIALPFLGVCTLLAVLAWGLSFISGLLSPLLWLLNLSPSFSFFPHYCDLLPHNVSPMFGCQPQMPPSPDLLPVIPGPDIFDITTDYLAKMIEIELPHPVIIHRDKSALQNLGHAIAARNGIEHQDIIVNAINDYVEISQRTIDALIMFQVRSIGSVDRFLLLTPSAIESWSSSKTKNKTEIFLTLIEQIHREVDYLQVTALRTQTLLSQMNEKIKFVSEYSVKSLANHNPPIESRLGMLWDLVAGSSSIPYSRYLENRGILLSIVNSTKTSMDNVGQILMLLAEFQHTLKDLQTSISAGQMTSTPTRAHLEIIRIAINRLADAKDRSSGKKNPPRIEGSV